jgi:uncharacterized protein (TIGR02271 family)
MHEAKSVRVTGQDGLSGTIDTTAWPVDRSHGDVLLRLDDGRELLVPQKALVAQNDGTFFLSIPRPQLEAALAHSEGTGTERGRGDVVVPVISEQLEVGSRRVETGAVRISKTVREEEQVIDQPLLREQVEVDRVPINKFVDSAPQVRQEEDTLIVPLVEEVIVVEKRLMLKEELRIRRHREQVQEPQTVKLRKEEAKIERISPRKKARPGTDVA